MVDTNEERYEPLAAEPLKLIGFRHWAWTPCHVKVWWGLALLYWLLRGLSFKVQELTWMNEPGYAGYFLVAFFPPLMLFVLAYGFIKARLNIVSPDEGFPSGDNASDDLFERRTGPSGLPVYFDPLDPRSGAFWIGNPLNPLNAGYVNRGP